MSKPDAPNDDGNTRDTGADNERQADDRGTSECLPAPSAATVLVDGQEERRGVRLLTELEADSNERIALSLANQRMLVRELLAPPKYFAEIASSALIRALEVEAGRNAQMRKLCREALRFDGRAEYMATARRAQSAMMEVVSSPALASAIAGLARHATAAADVLRDMNLSGLFEVTEAQRAVRAMLNGFAADVAQTPPRKSDLIGARHISSLNQQDIVGHKIGDLRTEHAASRHHRLCDALLSLTHELDPVRAMHRPANAESQQEPTDESHLGLPPPPDLWPGGGVQVRAGARLITSGGDGLLVTDCDVADVMTFLRAARTLGWQPARLARALTRQMSSASLVSIPQALRIDPPMNDVTEPLPTAGGTRTARSTVDQVVIRNMGGLFEIAFRDKVLNFPKLVGFEMLKVLTDNPDRFISCLDLRTAAAKRPIPRDLVGENETAARRYGLADGQARLSELNDEIDEAAAHSNWDRQEELEIEKDRFVSQVFGGRAAGGGHTVVSPELGRARKAAHAAIGFALKKISTELPPLEVHLRKQVDTGYFCRYRKSS